MKRLLLILAVLICTFTLWAVDFNVCVYPSVTEIEDYITRYFPEIKSSVAWTRSVTMRQENQTLYSAGTGLSGAWATENPDNIEKASLALQSPKQADSLPEKLTVKLVKYSGNADRSGLLKSDPMLLEYICRSANADLLVIPLSERVSEFNSLTICVYSPVTGNSEQVFFRLLQNSNVFTDEAAVALAPYFLTQEDVQTFTTVKPQIIRPVLAEYSINSNVPAEVYLNGIQSGTTPLVLNNVTIPSVVRLTAQGYADFVVNVDGKKTEVNAEMKPAWMNEGEFYSKSRNSFYRKMAVALGAFALKVGVRSLPVENVNMQNALKIGTDTLAVVSVFNLISGLFNYFMSADYLSQ